MTLKTPNELAKPREYQVKRWEVLQQEDHWAYNILTTSYNQQLIHQLAQELLTKIETQPDLYDEEFAALFYSKILSRTEAYPTPSDFKNDTEISHREYLIYYLYTNIKSSDFDSHIKLMCLLWLLPSAMLNKQSIEQTQRLWDIYCTEVTPRREHHIGDFIETKSDRFGNTQIPVKSKLFRNVLPRCHTAVQYQHYSKPQNPYVCQLIEANLPYVSGVSGMANSFSGIFSLLNIDMKSALGMQIRVCSTAFIIGAAMHSKVEVEHSFALTEQFFANQ
ncbi:hypothetical protein [Parashewanella curva]|nr:hypothetical protein [Parashewanella curva]